MSDAQDFWEQITPSAIDEDHWICLSDLMTGLMTIFLLLAILLLMTAQMHPVDTSHLNDHINDLANEESITPVALSSQSANVSGIRIRKGARTSAGGAAGDGASTGNASATVESVGHVSGGGTSGDGASIGNASATVESAGHVTGGGGAAGRGPSKGKSTSGGASGGGDQRPAYKSTCPLTQPPTATAAAK